MSDLELLRKYREERSDDAFALLVERHLDMVYSAALRQLRSTQLAEEVAQAVFSDLAQNCSRLKTETVLAAWLHEVTRRTAIDLIRKEARRQHREKIAVLMSEPNQNSPEWSKIEPFLDEALSRLNPKDRAAVLLRFFDDKPFREIGETLRISEDAAQKRVDRAIERLGKLLGAPGIRVGTASLAGCLSVHAVHAAPG
ncbi:MAG TPA: sigma-70 family RNA polymerase sigma factor, partial [Verrucomicrobiae bacterium]|nr:sigma-70 family RNA polymerase sigma factor [Verrucomicrobiae bacterium]